MSRDPAAPMILFWMMLAVGPLLLWLAFRSHGYKRRILERPPPGAWQPTEERFVDSATGVVVVVWFHPQSGARAYVRGTAS